MKFEGKNLECRIKKRKEEIFEKNNN